MMSNAPQPNAPGPALKPRRRVTADMLYLVRCEGRRVQGWQVRLPPWHPDGPSSRLFSDSQFAGPDGALQAARHFRQQAFAGLATPAPAGKHIHRHHRTNKMGLVGICLTSKHDRDRRGHTDDPDSGLLYWQAYWSTGHLKRQLSHYFPVTKFGFMGAWERAVELRQQKTGHRFTAMEMASARLRCLQRWRELMDKGIFYPAYVGEPPIAATP